MDSRDRSSKHGPTLPPQRAAQGGCGVLQTYLPHYVDPSGELLREPVGVRNMARFLTSIVTAGTDADVLRARRTVL